MCELAAEYHQRRRFREMQDRSSLWGRFQQFSEKLHGSLDLDTTAYVLANEGRSLIGSDRLTVAVRRGSKYRVRAVSGLDTFDRRSNVVRSVERLVRSVARTNEPLWYSGDTAGLPPQIAEPLEQYVVESNARFLAVLPLTPTEPARVGPDRSDAPRFSEDALPLGALVVERFEAGEPDDAFRHRVEAACRQSALALRNAVEYESIPLLPVLKLCRRLFRFLRLRHLPRTVAAALLVVAVVLALILVPADFEISARGELQPALRRDVFAPTDGVVRAIEVGQGDDVEKNQLLVALRNSELDLQHRRILGEIQTTQKELGTVAVSLRAANPNDPAELAEYNELAARENELTARLASLQEQQRIVQRQIDALQIRSPIDGEVLTWDLAARLEARPVKRGQVLMTVARVEGPWVVELEVADEHVGHVLQARRDLGEDLRVEFLLSADPTRTYAGWIERVSPSTELNEEGEPVVPVTVAFDRQEVGSLRPGASVAGRIQCGRRAIGYVWFHELLEAIQKRLLF